MVNGGDPPSTTTTTTTTTLCHKMEVFFYMRHEIFMGVRMQVAVV
jgi:hypothetical protein